ncbi:MAG: single-stranded-DNA-specific exonuclease RecJ [Calditrichaeota bacterium]|nr:single-stranded-DNA-specific exonuclease RecJ [Calditrichota bacterium]MBT7788847.1 single-stranded-DNA-specific exonuclease RecJ [Calditrichota bacterium]
MESKWEFYSPLNATVIGKMSEQLEIPKPVARVLYNRGIIETEDVRHFLRPKMEHLHDPFLMNGMDKAVDRLIIALREHEQILIYGDYDVDGITSTAMMYLFLKDLGGQVSFYIPDRATEGYGISRGGIEEARGHNCSLIISVDCGITSVKEVEIARELGIDLIVSDHHEPGESLPDAVAVIDPKRSDCAYPFKDLAGVGVAFKLAQGLIQKLNLDSAYAEKYLDLVAIGSAADIVPLIGENRVFTKLGLQKLNSNGLDGVTTLLETAGFKTGKIDVGQIIYGLAPRINAVGRLGRASPAVELLVTRNHSRARSIALQLEEENRRRKEIDSATLIEALSKIDSVFHPDRDSVIVLDGEQWHPGVIGIVASRIIERYYRPTVMISVDKGVGKGSARSVPNFDLHSALKSCADLFIQFGGHKYAAGLTIPAENIPEFRRRFNKIASEMLTPTDLIRKVNIDDEIELDMITYELLRMLNMLAPFGPHNRHPQFVSYNLSVVGTPRIVGNNHLKFKVSQNGAVIEAIAFNRGEDIKRLQTNRIVDLIYTIEENTWMDRSNLQLKIVDLR